jgi:hypothetical protein
LPVAFRLARPAPIVRLNSKALCPSPLAPTCGTISSTSIEGLSPRRRPTELAVRPTQGDLHFDEVFAQLADRLKGTFDDLDAPKRPPPEKA